jgi:conjugative relaxase-like TrwC/TraI family protein
MMVTESKMAWILTEVIVLFNMTKIRATSGAGKAFYHNHLSCNDYYSENEKVSGYWRGKLVWDLGLIGNEVDAETFSLLQKNINPDTLRKLTQRTVKTGVRFFDFQCAAPKSVSVLSMFDKRLIVAHREAVDVAMDELERLAAVRLRKGDQTRTNNYEITGNILYATFLHDASRALDPQLHSHNVVANVTKTADGEFKALESLEMVRAIRYAGKVYHNELARRCREMGYQTVNHLDDKGSIVWFDIEGVSEKIMDKFSKRRAQIEALEQKFIEEHGRKPTLGENNFISMTTRDQKLKEITADKVKKYQLKQLTYNQKWNLEQVVWNAEKNYWPEKVAGSAATVEMIQAALPAVYERDSVLKLDKVLAETLNQNFGKVDLKTLKAAVNDVPELKNLGGLEVNPYYSTEKIIQQELYAIESVETQKDLFEPIASNFVAFPGQETRQKQAELIHGMLSSKDRFNLFRGVAGAGKTSTLQELCKGLRSGGIESIHLIAPTNSATDVLKQEGFEQSQTVASFLLSQEKPPGGSYVIIDESGLNSLREGVEIVKVARANNYRVLFVGDARQHNAVENGDFFRLLEEHSEIERFSLTDIHRQQNEEYRRGISDCALGRFEAAFERFDQNGFIHEGKSKYLSQAADSYMEYTENGQFIDRAILVAPTHDEGDKLTDAVRSKLKEFGSIKGDGQAKEVFRSWNWPKARLRDAGNYQPGMAVAFIRNMKDIAKAGETVTVTDIKDGNLILDNGKAIYARRCAEFIEVGERHEIELCEGDLIQFNVNLRDQRIYNGNIAMITADPDKVMMLYSDGRPRELVDLPTEYDTFKYGWVTTSYKSQGRTAENVVVAAQSLDRKAFYVALSRGRQHMALHCPEKEFLKARLSLNSDRNSVHDLVKAGEIRQDAILNLSEEAREAKAKTLPDTTYKSIKGRAARIMEYVKELPRRISAHTRKVFSRRARFNKYGFGVISEKTYFAQDMKFAVEAKPEIKVREEPPTEKYPMMPMPPPGSIKQPEPQPPVDRYPMMDFKTVAQEKPPVKPEPSVDRYPMMDFKTVAQEKPPVKPEPPADRYPMMEMPPVAKAEQSHSKPPEDKYPMMDFKTATPEKRPAKTKPPADRYPMMEMPSSKAKDKPLEQQDRKAGPELPVITITKEARKKKSKAKDVTRAKQQIQKTRKPREMPPPKKKPSRGMDR